jgi:acetyl-CoA carboxylase carboxyltransferase component
VHCKCSGVDVVFRNLYRDRPDPTVSRQEIIAKYKAQTGWEPAAAGFGVDDVIDPRDTRIRLIEWFEFCPSRRVRAVSPKYHPITPV